MMMQTVKEVTQHPCANICEKPRGATHHNATSQNTQNFSVKN